MSYLRVENLRKSVGGRTVLDVRRLELEPGSVRLLQGPNGSGKTTLLKVLAGLLAPDEAEITFEGAHCRWRTFRRRCHRRVIYLHQQAYMFDGTVAANVAYGLKQAGERRPALRGRVESALEWAGLSGLAQRNARVLSGGEKQRVALARAWAIRPRLLLLDEATAHLDSAGRALTWAMVERLGREGIGVLVTSHEEPAALPSGLALLRLENGTLTCGANTP